ncbi:MAG: tRNA pseudouridine(55) synthase TruB [Candidatus Kerfeldbacteria bacterium]
MNGIFGINKKVGPTSHDIIDQLRRKTGIKKIGHAGTLDPLASGVLVVAIGKEFTRQIDTIVKTEKEYIAKVKFGFNSTTDDEEGEKEEIKISNEPTKEDIEKVLPKFIGEIKQMPPVYSSVKVSGKPAHRRVRKGEDVKLGTRDVFIKNIEILDYQWPYLEIKIVTGPGVYIRSLARDIGSELKVGGYLSGLIRTRVGDYNIDDAVTVEKFNG